MARNFKMNGKVYTSMTEIAKELGKSRIRPKDFDKYGITEEVVEAEAKPFVDSTAVYFAVRPDIKTVKAKSDNEPKSDSNPSTDDKVKQSNTRRTKEKEVILIEDLVKDSLENFHKKVHKVGMDALVEFAKKEGVDIFEEVSNPSIRRMRIVFGVRTKYFGDDKIKYNKSGFEKVDIETLFKLANDNNLAYKKSDNKAIQRMWLIYSLKQAHIDPPEVVSNKETKDDTEVKTDIGD